MRTLIASTLFAILVTTTVTSSAAPRKPATASEKLAKARAKVTKATKSSRAAITRADTAIERCERAIVDLCQVEHGLTGAQCEDAALAAQFSACHETSSQPHARSWVGKGRVVTPAQRAAYVACLDEVSEDDETSAAERCAGELE